jgi:hypothetical protein
LKVFSCCFKPPKPKGYYTLSKSFAIKTTTEVVPPRKPIVKYDLDSTGKTYAVEQKTACLAEDQCESRRKAKQNSLKFQSNEVLQEVVVN